MFAKGTRFPLARVSAIFIVLLVGPTVLPQKMNFSNHMLRKAVCSLTDIELVFMFSVTYLLQPLMVLVLKISLVQEIKGSVGGGDIQTSQHHNI